jgi:hypothetical protein
MAAILGQEIEGIRFPLPEKTPQKGNEIISHQVCVRVMVVRDFSNWLQNEATKPSKINSSLTVSLLIK